MQVSGLLNASESQQNWLKVRYDQVLPGKPYQCVYIVTRSFHLLLKPIKRMNDDENITRQQSGLLNACIGTIKCKFVKNHGLCQIFADLVD